MRERAGVVVCRGCCCGDARRDPHTDHDAQLGRLLGLADAHPEHITVRTSDCLGPCAQANVLVVRPSRTGRGRGGRPVWFGFVRDPRALELLGDWLTAGGPGLASMPGELELHVVAAPGRPGRGR